MGFHTIDFMTSIAAAYNVEQIAVAFAISAISFALQLYLDFINIFIYILQLVAKQSSDS